MKKSTALLILGILLIVVSYVADLITVRIFGYITWNDTSNIIGNVILISVLGAMLIVGIILIVVSRKVAKKEKSKQQ